MMPTPENYAKTLSQLDFLRAEVAAMHRNVMEQEMRLADVEFDKATKTMLDKCRTDLEAAKKALIPLMDRIAEVTRRVYGFGPDNDDRARALRSCQGKKQYRSPEGAGAAAASAKARGSQDELRIYKCDLCWSYHLTSVPLEMFAEGPQGTRDDQNRNPLARGREREQAHRRLAATGRGERSRDLHRLEHGRHGTAGSI